MPVGIDIKGFRKTCRRIPSSVAIVTTCDSFSVPYGLTINAIVSLSLNPPSFLICIDNSSRTLNIILKKNTFLINILADNQSNIAKNFSSKELNDKFSDISWIWSPNYRLPMIKGSAVHIECCIDHVHRIADHTIIKGDVCYTCINNDRSLIYMNGKYCSASNISI